MNEKDLRTKNYLCIILAMLYIIEIVGEAILPEIGRQDGFLLGVATSLISFIPEIVLVVFAFKKAPHKFVVPIYFIAAFRLLSAAFWAFLSFANGVSEGLDVIMSMVDVDSRQAVFVCLSAVIIAAFYFICARAILRQKNGGNGFSKMFLVTEFVLLALTIASDIISYGFELIQLFGIIEKVVLIIIVKYVEDESVNTRGGLINYPEPEEMNEGE